MAKNTFVAEVTFKKTVLQLLLCFFVMQNIQIFLGGVPVMFVFTCFNFDFIFYDRRSYQAKSKKSTQAGDIPNKIIK